MNSLLVCVCVHAAWVWVWVCGWVGGCGCVPVCGCALCACFLLVHEHMTCTYSPTYKDFYSYSLLQIQAIARMWKARTAYRDRLKYFKDHVSLLYNKFGEVSVETSAFSLQLILCKKKKGIHVHVYHLVIGHIHLRYIVHVHDNNNICDSNYLHGSDTLYCPHSARKLR